MIGVSAFGSASARRAEPMGETGQLARFVSLVRDERQHRMGVART
jgi:hypothetical protein